MESVTRKLLGIYKAIILYIALSFATVSVKFLFFENEILSGILTLVFAASLINLILSFIRKDLRREGHPESFPEQEEDSDVLKFTLSLHRFIFKLRILFIALVAACTAYSLKTIFIDNRDLLGISVIFLSISVLFLLVGSYESHYRYGKDRNIRNRTR
jgi:hypothetical protein